MRRLEPLVWAAAIMLLSGLVFAEGRRNVELSAEVPLAPEELYRKLARSQVRLQIIDVREGYLTTVDIRTDGRYRPSHLEQRIRRAAPGPVNIRALEEELRLVQADERIASLQATLTPGEQPGESVLDVVLSEHRALQFDADVSNDQSPSIGADNASLATTTVGLFLYDNDMNMMSELGATFTAPFLAGSDVFVDASEPAFMEIEWNGEVMRVPNQPSDKGLVSIMLR